MNKLGKLTPNLADGCHQTATRPAQFQECLGLGEPQEKAINTFKKLLSFSLLLALHSPDHDNSLSTDASAYALGVLSYPCLDIARVLEMILLATITYIQLNIWYKSLYLYTRRNPKLHVYRI